MIRLSEKLALKKLELKPRNLFPIIDMKLNQTCLALQV